ncbi:hypothetical protein [uncultured Sphingomonas sp.]|uniref:hypothetical protein n=1 Tax=uncultured Sphingomonas sp. TaxID=158754 RepID=UPI0025CBD936|nr:hypothetical protein [uncultured Sphingomonas sp.]
MSANIIPLPRRVDRPEPRRPMPIVPMVYAKQRPIVIDLHGAVRGLAIGVPLALLIWALLVVLP